MTVPYFYTTPPEIKADGTIVGAGATAAVLEEALVNAIQSNDGLQTIKLLGRSNVFSQFAVEALM